MRNYLSDEVKRRIVVELARFRTSGEIARMLRDEYGLELRHHTIQRYAPTSPGCRTGEPLRRLFDEARRAFIEESGRACRAHLGYRLNRFRRLSEQAERDGDLALAAKLLEQAARDRGGLLTGKSGPGARAARAPLAPVEARARIQAWLEAGAMPGRARRRRPSGDRAAGQDEEGRGGS